MTLDLKDKDMVSMTDSLTQLPNRKKRKKQKTLEADSCILSHILPCINNAHHTWQPLPTGKGGVGGSDCETLS